MNSDTLRRMIPSRHILLGAATLLVIAAIPACGPSARRSELPPPPPDAWSVRMADAFVARNPDSISYPESKRPERWDYEQGLILEAIKQVSFATGDDRFIRYLKKNIDAFVGEDGSIRTYDLLSYNIDNINTGRQVLFLYEETGDARYRAAAETLRTQLRQHPRTNSGGFWHKKIYPYQMWLDGIYMGQPFYTQYAAAFGDTAAFDDVAFQILEIERRTRDAETGLLYHGWDESRQQRWADPATGCSPNFWGRAMGWYAMGIVDVLDAFPPHHPQRDEIIAALGRLITAVAAYQDSATGVWYQVLDQGSREGNYKEASCTAMFSYAIAKGVRQGYLDSTWLPVAQKAFDGMLQEFVRDDADGMPSLHHVCSVSGLGGDPYRDGSFEYYIGEPQRTNDLKGLGPFILAALELGR